MGFGCDVTDLLTAGLDGTLLRMIVSHFVMVIDPVETRRGAFEFDVEFVSVPSVGIVEAGSFDSGDLQLPTELAEYTSSQRLPIHILRNNNQSPRLRSRLERSATS